MCLYITPRKYIQKNINQVHIYSCFQFYKIEKAFKKMNYTVTFDEVEKGILFWTGLMTYFAEYVIDDIWQNDPNLVEHLKNKYRNCKNEDGTYDYVCFYLSLDQSNRRRLVSWYNGRITRETIKF